MLRSNEGEEEGEGKGKGVVSNNSSEFSFASSFTSESERDRERQEGVEEVGGDRRDLVLPGVSLVVVAVAVAAAVAVAVVDAAAFAITNISLSRLPFLTGAPVLAELHAAPPRGATGRGICGWEDAEAAPGGAGM